MSLTESSELADVLNRVKRWSDADRFALVKGVLETLAPKVVTPSPVPLRAFRRGDPGNLQDRQARAGR